MARSAFLLARHLPAHGVDVRGVVHREGYITDWMRAHGVAFDVVPELMETPLRGAPGQSPVSALWRNLSGWPRGVARLAALAHEHDAQVLYSHGTIAHHQAALAGRKRLNGSHPAVVWHIRNDHSRWLTRTAGRFVGSRPPVRAVIAVSNATARPYLGMPTRTEVVHNGVDIEALDASAAPPVLRATLGVGPEAVLAGYVGRLVPHKGYEVLLAAARIALERDPRMHVAFLGGNAPHLGRDAVAEVRETARGWGLANRIHTLGYQAEIARYLADLDIVVVPSTCQDACPRAVLEGLALGVPVIASDIGGIPEIVRDDVDGMLVPAGHVDALAHALTTLSGDDRRRKMLGAAGRDRMVRDFDAHRVAGRVAAILRDAATTS